MGGGVMSLSMSSNRFTWDGLEQGEEGGAGGGEHAHEIKYLCGTSAIYRLPGYALSPKGHNW